MLRRTSWFLVSCLVFPRPKRSERAIIVFYFNDAFPFGGKTPWVKTESTKTLGHLQTEENKGEIYNMQYSKVPRSQRNSNLLQYNHAAQWSTVLLLVQDLKAI